MTRFLETMPTHYAWLNARMSQANRRARIL